MKLRVAGAALMVLCVLAFQPGAATLTQLLLIPTGMAIGTALIVRNLLAVLLTAALLGLIQTNWAHFLQFLTGPQPDTDSTTGALASAVPSSEPLAWVAGVAYPLLAGVCLLFALGILSARFRRHMEATRAARQALRDSRSTAEPAASSPSKDTTDADQERPHEG